MNQPDETFTVTMPNGLEVEYEVRKCNEPIIGYRLWFDGEYTRMIVDSEEGD